MLGFLIILIVAAGVVFWAVGIYNRLVRLRNMVEEGWSGIDVQLKRRAEILTVNDHGILECCTGFA